ncbi:FixH family protein [Pedobacter hartonius]|uniref:FixH protein n=1 Tax=Pedobacter hartonius TaxID=425514 RepID=A0A1H3X6A1_9SPHI|nr:FixH family protein [Pedobacter hartonius]SDZ94929.1 hypothetical protein SAMN05443550_101518 [Pedobacter hartonius]
MNWGTKIVLGLATFMIFIVVLGLIMFNSKKDALVDNDYYEKGINYNKVYNRKEQTNTDHARPEVSANQEMIIVKFVHNAKGTARLMRTSDKELDKTIPFESNINRQLIIPARNLKKGSWRLIIEWVSDEKSYMYEQEITL